MATNPYDQFDPPPMQAPQQPGVIYGRPKAPPPQTPADQRSDELANTIAELTIAEKQRKLQEESKPPVDTREQIRQLEVAMANLDNIEQMAKGAFFGQGVGNIAGREGFQSIPVLGQTSANIAGALEMVTGDLINQVRQQQAEAGITVGATQLNTEKEAARMAASIANLSQTQDEENFLRGIENARAFYRSRLEKLVGPSELQQTMAAQGGVGPTDQGAIGYTPEGLQVRVTDDSPAPPAGGGGSEFWQQIGLGTGDIVEGVGDVAGIVGNPLNAGINAAFGTNLSTDIGQTLRDMSGLPQSSDNIYSTINKFGAGAGAGSLGARAVSNALSPGVAQSVAGILGRTPIRDTVAGAGAGAGSYAGRESGIPGGEYAGALVGGVAGYGAGGAGMNALMPRSPSPIAQAATRQGVDLLPADVGGRATQMVTSGAKASPISAGPVVRQAQENTAQLASAARRTAEGQGDVVTTDVAGQNIRRGAENYAEQSKARWGRLYERAYEEAGDTKIVPAKTLAAIDERIARLKNDPSAPPSAVDEMQRFRDNIAGGVNILGLRDARTRLSEGVYDGKLRSNVDQAAWKEILGNLSDDIGEGLTAAGKTRAAAMFKRADEGWRSRVEHIDEVLQPIIGRDGTKSGEDVLKAVESMAKGGSGGNARLSRLLANMAPEEAGQVRAVIIDRLGKATPGAQDAAGEAFSPATFLTNWNRMTPQAKASLFSNSQLRKDLNDIAVLADGMKATRSLDNFSNTALSIGSNTGAGIILWLIDPLLTGSAVAGQYLTGRLMASPGFARLLASTAKSKAPPEIANRRFSEQLGVLASKEPLIANDIQAVQAFLRDAAAQSPGRAAADDEGNGGQPIPEQ